MSLDRALAQLEIVVVDEQTAERVRHGAPVPVAKILRWEGAADGDSIVSGNVGSLGKGMKIQIVGVGGRSQTTRPSAPGAGAAPRSP